MLSAASRSASAAHLVGVHAALGVSALALLALTFGLLLVTPRGTPAKVGSADKPARPQPSHACKRAPKNLRL